MRCHFSALIPLVICLAGVIHFCVISALQYRFGIPDFDRPGSEAGRRSGSCWSRRSRAVVWWTNTAAVRHV